MGKEFLYIDDSGDTGFKKSSSSHFLIATVIVLDEGQVRLLSDAISLFRRELGWSELDEFKFSKTNKKTILNVIDLVKAYDFSAQVIVLDKSRVNTENIPKEKETLHFQVIKELLLKLDLSNPVITIDGRAGRKYAKRIRTFLRQGLKERGILRSQIYFVDSRKSPLVQLADIVVGAVARSLNKDKTDSDVYLKALSGVITNIYEIDFL
ncbi:MAG: DUF3800 domain-containing protein [Oscillospiraceae bacterium]|nr:DUF3800 domain-containing protein [Oscillospiraceae bacterium]